MDGRKYYEAYDDRYRQVHQRSLQWFSGQPSRIVEQTMEKYGVSHNARILEIGCGEGRDAAYLCERGYRVLATDVSRAAIEFCRSHFPDYADRFRILDCLSQNTGEAYDFLYSVAVLHMLVPDEDRRRFYAFIRGQLTYEGIALICAMGDGRKEWHSDIQTAFEPQKRTHEATGTEIMIAGTSCRVVSFETLKAEIAASDLALLEIGSTSVLPDFPEMLYAVVKKRRSEQRT